MSATEWAAIALTARARLGLTQHEMAALLEVRPQEISRWERGEHLPLPPHREALCNLLGIAGSDYTQYTKGAREK